MQIRGSLHSNSRSCPCRPARELLCREELHTSFSRSDGQSSGSWDAGCSHLPNTDLQEQVHNHTHTCMQTHTNGYIPHGKKCPTSLRLWTQLDSPLNFPCTTQQIVNTTFYRTVERRDRLPVLSESEKCVHNSLLHKHSSPALEDVPNNQNASLCVANVLTYTVF